MNANNKPENNMFDVDYLQYLKILSEQKAFIIVFCLSAILSSLALTYIFSERYETGVAIFYQPSEYSLLSMKDTESFGSPAPSTTYKMVSQTLTDIIKSEVILRPVVKKLRLDEEIEVYEPVWYKRWYKEAKDYMKELASNTKMILKYGRIIQVDPTEEAIQYLRKYLKISSTKESFIYLLTVRDKYPERAAGIADTAGEILIDWIKEQYKVPAEERRSQLLRDLEKKEEDIRVIQKNKEDLLRKYNIYSISEELDEAVQNIYGLEQESIQISSQIEEKRIKIHEFGNEIQKMVNHHPDDYKKMKSAKLFDEIELNGLTGKLDSINASIDKYKTRLNKMPSLQNKLDELEMMISAETREYKHLKDFYLENASQAAIEHGETKVLHSASVPTKPVQPIKGYHVGLTALLSIFISTGLVFIFAFFNIRIFFSSNRFNDVTEASEKTREASP